MTGPSPLANSRSKPSGSRIKRISANRIAASTPRTSAAVTVTSVARSGFLHSSRNGTRDRIARYSAMYRPACLISQMGVTLVFSRRQARRKGESSSTRGPSFNVGSAAGPTEDERLLNRSMPAEPAPLAPELGAFTHTDFWRVLRIQGEFVHGINALAEVGAAVAVFGSARFGQENPLYETARHLGKLLAEAGFAVITGGGPGIMEAANRGAHEASGYSIGCNIELPFEQ